MNKERFNELCEEDKELVFNEMCELYSLIENYPINIDDLKIFTEWHQHIRRWGKQLYNLLIGMYPYPELNKNPNKEKLEELLKYSNNVVDLVNFWNRQIKAKIEIQEL
jgi:hypothetical protein